MTWTAPTAWRSSPPTSPASWSRLERAVPLLVGVGENEFFVASDASPLLQHTRSVVYLDDGEMAVLTRDGYRVRNLEIDPNQQAGQPDRLGPGDGGAERLSRTSC